MEFVEPERESSLAKRIGAQNFSIGYFLDDFACLPEYSQQTGQIHAAGLSSGTGKAFVIRLEPEFDLTIEKLQRWIDEYGDEYYKGDRCELERISFTENPAEDEPSLLMVTTPEQQYKIDAVLLSPEELPKSVLSDVRRHLDTDSLGE